MTPEPAACSRRWGLSGKLKKRRKKGSRKSGLSSIGARVATEMFTTAGVTCCTIGARVGSPLLSTGTAAAAFPASTRAIRSVPAKAPVMFARFSFENTEKVVVVVGPDREPGDFLDLA